MNRKIVLLLVSTLLISCGGGSKSTSGSSSSSSSSKSGESSSSSSGYNTSSHTQDEFNKYKTALLSSSEKDHFYIHYYRFNHTSEEYNQYDFWVWNKSIGGEGAKFDFVGRTTDDKDDLKKASGNATIDDFGYATIDIDLNKEYDGGWDATNKKMGGYTVSFKGKESNTFCTKLGVQIVYSESRTSSSGFWKNDGGDQSVTIEDFKITEGDKSFYHLFLVQDNISNHMSLEDIGACATIVDPFEDDDGTNYTYGKDEYKTADFTNDKPIANTSESFLNEAGVGYQIMVSSFADSDGDGFGDIYGIYQKLDYIKELGVNVIWLTPIQLSDSYHGYDIADYETVDAKYGSKVSTAALANKGVVTTDTAKADYKELLNKAHELGMKVVMDLVINHTSTTNKWFIDSAKLDKAHRGYYQWGNHVTDANNINEDKCWYPYGSHVYSYYAKFGTSMPELNYAYADTRSAVTSIALNWLAFGVDGFRMDAVKHIFLADEVSSDSKDTIVLDKAVAGDYSSNLTKNLNFWKELNYNLKAQYPNAFIVGENFDGHAYHVSPYYEGFDSLFDFYSYFNLTSLAAKANNNSLGYSMTASKFLGGTKGDSYTASGDASLSGNKTTSIKYSGEWNLKGVLNTNNKYRTGGNSVDNASGYSAINGAFTSNHDIARTINRVAGTTYNNDGLTAQGNITASNYQNFDELATLVQIAELMLPGLTWIYYGDELGLTGNFPSGTTSSSSYSDLAYRQPMKWTDNSDGDYMTSYSVTGSGQKVELDSINSSNLVKSVENKDSSSHYQAIRDFATAKSGSKALIKGNFTPYEFTGNDYILNFIRTLGSESYKVLINMSSKKQTIKESGSIEASYNGASLTSLPAHSAILINMDGETPTPTPAEDKTYTVTGVTNISDGKLVYAWAWTGSAGGIWYKCTIDGSSVSFSAPNNITGCLIAKFNTAPADLTVWSTPIIQSKDITSISDTMVFPGWK